MSDGFTSETALNLEDLTEQLWDKRKLALAMQCWSIGAQRPADGGTVS